MSVFAKKVLGVGMSVVAIGVLIGFYVATWATSAPASASATIVTTPLGKGANLELESVAAVGAAYSPANPDWVSYLVRSNGKWVHGTTYKLPANSLIHMTINQYDSPTGLRNPFLSQVQGTVGGTETIDGKTVSSIPPEEASHTFAIPQLGVFVPLPGVSEEAKNPCEEAPCETKSSDHRTVTFTFRTGKKGRYRWQCFVPCGAGYIAGNGGPMQTLGYMSGFIEVE